MAIIKRTELADAHHARHAMPVVQGADYSEDLDPHVYPNATSPRGIAYQTGGFRYVLNTDGEFRRMATKGKSTSNKKMTADEIDEFKLAVRMWAGQVKEFDTLIRTDPRLSPLVPLIFDNENSDGQ